MITTESSSGVKEGAMQIVWVPFNYMFRSFMAYGGRSCLESSWTKTWHSGTACRAVAERTIYD
jgi:hypothetical protein